MISLGGTMVLRDRALPGGAVARSGLPIAQGKHRCCSVQIKLKLSGAHFRLVTKHERDPVPGCPLVGHGMCCKRPVCDSSRTHGIASGRTPCLPAVALPMRQRRGYRRLVIPICGVPPTIRKFKPLSTAGHTADRAFPTRGASRPPAGNSKASRKAPHRAWVTRCLSQVIAPFTVQSTMWSLHNVPPMAVRNLKNRETCVKRLAQNQK